MGKTVLSPISIQVPIVNAEGKPTPEFQRLFQQLSISSNLDISSNGEIDFADIAAQTILANKLGVTGPVTSCTVSDILDFIGSVARGDLIYRGAAGWARLPAGTSGQYLKTQGTGADPIWATVATGSSGWSQIGFYDFAVSGAAGPLVAPVTGLAEALVVFNGANSAVSAWNCIQYSTDGGLTYFTTSGNYQDLSGSGTFTAENAIYTHGTNATGARYSYGLCRMLNTTLGLKPIDCPQRNAIAFTANALPITHIRAFKQNSGGTAVNFSGGQVAIYGRT